MAEKVVAQVGDKQIIIETGKYAKQADGAVTVQLGETIVVVAAVAASKAKPGQDFFPLTVDYREKAAAAGKFPGGQFKREGRPTEKEILTSRLTDRPIRPLSPKGWYNAALKFGHECCQPLILCQRELTARGGKRKREISLNVVPDEILNEAKNLSGGRMVPALLISGKLAREAAVKAVTDEIGAKLIEK